KMAGYDSGQFIDSVTREIYSERTKPFWAGEGAKELPSIDCFAFIPLMRLPDEYINWKDRSKGETGWNWKTCDLDDPIHQPRLGLWAPKGKWKHTTEEKKSPPTTEVINVIGIPYNVISRER